MHQLPEAEIYERGLRYWPYKDSLVYVFDWITKHAPQNGTLVDIMCGPGYLLSQISKNRKDLKLFGLDIDERYIAYGRETYPEISFFKQNILDYQVSGSPVEVIVCTGALHHIQHEQQEKAISNIAASVSSGGFAIISDAYVGEHSNETTRKLAAARLGYEYLSETILNGADDAVLDFTVGILSNDVLNHEFKTTVKRRSRILEKYFATIQTTRTWPRFVTDYGDYVHVCSVN